MDTPSKACSKCAQSKPPADYYARKNGRSSAACRPCHIAGVLAAKQRRKQREQMPQQA